MRCWEEHEEGALPCSNYEPIDVPVGFNTERFLFSIWWS